MAEAGTAAAAGSLHGELPGTCSCSRRTHPTYQQEGTGPRLLRDLRRVSESQRWSIKTWCSKIKSYDRAARPDVRRQR